MLNLGNRSGLLGEVIDTFIFRNEGAITIPKRKRELAYAQSVDVVVTSIDFNLYENSKAVPSLQFYGYATLVFQDCLILEVPLRFPRQRIHSARNESALTQWRTVAEVDNYFSVWNDFYFDFFTASQDPKPEKPFNKLIIPRFIELPLREVYVKLQSNSQFEIEYSQYEPLPFEREGLVYTGESTQEDGNKDNGLPSNGIQPSRNNPSDPFSGNKPISSPLGLGDFFNDKSDSLSNEDPTNEEPVLTGQRLFFGGSWISRFVNGLPETISEENPSAVPFPFTGCQIGIISSQFVSSYETVRGAVNIISFRRDGSEFVQAQFLNTSGDFNIVACAV